MEDIKKGYKVTLERFQERQDELGLTDLEVSNWLGIKPSNYRRLISGAYPMTVPRFEQLCSVLGFGFCVIDKDILTDFQRCVEEEVVDMEDVAVGNE